MLNIVVPVDFSKNSIQALELAAQIATAVAGHLHLVHVYTPLESIFIDNKAQRDAWNLEQKRAHEDRLLDTQKEIQEKHPGVNCEPQLLTGNMLDVLLAFCKEEKVQLIIMGTHGASGLAETIVGSNAAALIGQSPIPVLAVPATFDGKKAVNLVLAVRHFIFNSAGLDVITVLSRALSVKLSLVLFQEKDMAAATKETNSRALQDYANWVQEIFPQVNVFSNIVEGEAFTETMQAYCSANGPAILAMVTHRRNFWEQFWVPSLTRKMVFRTQIPLLSLPAGEESGA